MEPYQIDNLMDIVATLLYILTGAGGLSLIVYSISKARGRIFSGADPEQLKKLVETNESLLHAVGDLQAEQASLQREIRDRVGEISGRVEFAERLLTERRE